ncbi:MULTISPECIES: dTDP-4-dehydrorhamnose 3,5-epimerase [Polaromonas]|uniref:dTDP-4-dehydrorhamnose 3,5-epimerase n=1 Tax=Polaromonas aquatica TaxID=332657 RepID=A0ABW1TZT1_9BURK
MKVIPTALPEVLLIQSEVHTDARGLFFESFNRRDFEQVTGLDGGFVQDNHSRSVRHVLRGLHYQLKHPQGKLVRVVRGSIWDVAVDIRRSSPNFMRSVALELSARESRQLWVPPGFAHGFLVLSKFAEVLYKTTDYYAVEHERCIRWDDPNLAIAWPLAEARPLLSARDCDGETMAEAELPP